MLCDAQPDRKSTRLNSSHDQISYAVFCLKKKWYPVMTFDGTCPTPPFFQLSWAASVPAERVSITARANTAVLRRVRMAGLLVFFLFLGTPRNYPLFPPSRFSQ